MSRKAGTDNLKNDSVVNEFVVKQRRLQDVLDERNMHEIDYVSRDVEGAEIEVLDGVDFSKTMIKCVTIENNDDMDSQGRLREYMVDKGFMLVARLTHDDVYLNKECFGIYR